eukprot:jgi/Astpho2/2016/e_gw1.00038.121.1_t
MLLFGFATYLTNSLSLATVSAVTDKLQQQDVEGAGHALSAALVTGTVIGCIILVAFQVFSRQLIVLTGAAAELVGPSVSYLKIRAWSAPAVLITMVAQSGLLAQKDSLTPLIWVVVQTILNIVGDVLLIKVWKGGLPGAAWATLLSQLAGTAGLVWMMGSKGKIRPSLRVPRRHELRMLNNTAGPATVLYACKNICYLMLQGTATTLQPLLVAGHQPCRAEVASLQVWNLFAYCHAPMEQAALAFLPTLRDRTEANELVKLLIGVGVVVGVITAIAAAGFPSLLPQAFTSDQALWPVMRSIAPQAVGSMLFCALDITLTGVLMAERDLPFIAKTMACNMFVLAGYFAVARAKRWQLRGVWSGLMLFFFVRMMQSSTRVWLLLFRGKKKAPAAEGSVIESVPERSGLIAQTEIEDV